MPEEYGMPQVLIEPPPELEREFSNEFKKARKKFGKLAEKKIQEAVDTQQGMDGSRKINDAQMLMDQMKRLEFMP